MSAYARGYTLSHGGKITSIHCSVCIANGHCELQSMAQRLGMDHVRVPYIAPRRQVDASHARFTFDANRCILCTRCIRVCDEIEGAHTWNVMGRGIASRVITDLNEPWDASTTCTSCGKCVQVCPTRALVEICTPDRDPAYLREHGEAVERARYPEPTRTRPRRAQPA